MSKSLEDLRAQLAVVVEEQDTRYRGETKLSQLHRNEWPALWKTIDEIVAWWPGDGEEEAQPGEVPVVANFDENDDVVGFEELPEIPEPGEILGPEGDDGSSPWERGEGEAEDKNHPNVITSGPIPPPARRKSRETYGEEFSLPEGPE